MVATAIKVCLAKTEMPMGPQLTTVAVPPKPQSFDIQAYFRELQKKCDEILSTSVEDANAGLMASSRQFCSELGAWHIVLGDRRETELLRIPKHVPLPASLSFDKDVFTLWHSKSAIVARIVHFSLCLRYMSDLRDAEVDSLEPALSDRLGHVAEIRSRLGGPTKS
jgi:hypothetical protein